MVQPAVMAQSPGGLGAEPILALGLERFGCPGIIGKETGFDVRIDRIIGIYSDPGHVFAYSDGEVRQEFNICLAATIVGGEQAVSKESTDVRFVAYDELDGLTMHPSIRKRIDDYFAGGEPRLR